MRKTILSFILLVALATYFFVSETGKNGDAPRGAASSKLLDLAEGDEITLIRITKGDVSFAFEGKEGVWRIVDPILEMGNALILGGIERILTLQNKDKILSEPNPDRAVYGLVPAEIKVGVVSKSQPVERTLLLGKKAPLEDMYYAQWEGSDEVFLMMANARNAFDKDLSSVRNRSIFAVSDQDHVKIIDCSSDIFSITLEYDKDNDRWLIKAPFEELARTDKVDELLDKIKGIYIEEFLDKESVDDPKFGLAGSQSFIRMTTVYDKETTMHLGAMTDDMKKYYAHVAGRTAPVLVASDMLDSLRKDPNEFIERRIAHFNEFAVDKIVYAKGGNEHVLSQIDYAWHRDNTKLEGAPETAVSDLIQHLAALEYTLILNADGETALALGDEDKLFAFTVNMTTPDGSVPPVVFTFYAKRDGFFVRTSREEHLYEITKESYDKTIAFVEVLYG